VRESLRTRRGPHCFVVRIDSENDRQKKLSRWQSIVESAAKQCGNDSIPRISVALDLKSLLDELSSLRSADDRAFICSLAPGAKLPAELTPPTNRVHLAVGAEGDFTDKEEATLCESGFEKLSLGPLVLRCETAAIVAISMVHGAWGFLPTSEES
jgi:16S rRNA (uracil1498-N3)-methyltransferase